MFFGCFFLVVFLVVFLVEVVLGEVEVDVVVVFVVVRVLVGFLFFFFVLFLFFSVVFSPGSSPSWAEATIPWTMSITPSSWDLLVVAGGDDGVVLLLVLLVVPPGEAESPFGDLVVAGRLLGVLSAEDEVQSDSFRPISQPSCFKPAMENITSTVGVRARI